MRSVNQPSAKSKKSSKNPLSDNLKSTIGAPQKNSASGPGPCKHDVSSSIKPSSIRLVAATMKYAKNNIFRVKWARPRKISMRETQTADDRPIGLLNSIAAFEKPV
jgi:hypothetical protein